MVESGSQTIDATPQASFDVEGAPDSPVASHVVVKGTFIHIYVAQTQTRQVRSEGDLQLLHTASRVTMGYDINASTQVCKYNNESKQEPLNQMATRSTQSCKKDEGLKKMDDMSKDSAIDSGQKNAAGKVHYVDDVAHVTTLHKPDAKAFSQAHPIKFPDACDDKKGQLSRITSGSTNCDDEKGGLDCMDDLLESSDEECDDHVEHHLLERPTVLDFPKALQLVVKNTFLDVTDSSTAMRHVRSEGGLC